MGKEYYSKSLVLGATSIVCFLAYALLYAAFSSFHINPFETCNYLYFCFLYDLRFFSSVNFPIADDDFGMCFENEGKHQVSYMMSGSVVLNGLKVDDDSVLINIIEVKESQGILLRRLVNKGWLPLFYMLMHCNILLYKYN